MNSIKQLALFFRSTTPDALYWVRAPIAEEQADAPALAALVLNHRPDLEFVAYGQTEYAVDDEYFHSHGDSKRLVFVDDCHLHAFAEAHGCAPDELDNEYVLRHLWRIGIIEFGVFRTCPPEVVDRVNVTSTRIPDSLEDLITDRTISMEIIDYTEISSTLLRRPTPQKQHGKAVLIRHAEQHFFVMAPQDFCRFHADIVQRFYELRKLRTVKNHTRVEAVSDQWQVLGGCCYEADYVAAQINFYGQSDAYGPVSNVEPLRQGLLSSDAFCSLAVRLTI